MKLVVSKLSPREEVAFGAFLRRHFASWQCELLPEQRPSQLPPADLYVLDLAPMGFRHGSEQALATLRESGGMHIHDPSAAQRQQLRAATAEVYQGLERRIGRQWLDQVQHDRSAG